tara:strand:+ start:20915 stop:21952 length:1038 start_codon:yes stop_codon:yes gene_type:complete
VIAPVVINENDIDVMTSVITTLLSPRIVLTTIAHALPPLRLALRLILAGVLLMAPLLSQADADVNADAKPKLLVSIKPIQLIALAIAGDTAEVELLLAPNVSPHLYQLKPSDRQLLANAELVIWVGPSMERFLAKPLSLLPSPRVLTLLNESELDTGADIEPDQDEHGHSEHQHHGQDPHIWLSPVQAQHIARQIAQRLSTLLPAQRLTFEQNLQRFSAQLAALDAQLQQQFKALQPKPYMVLHDGYGHFERHYGQRHAAVLSLSPDKKPGAKHLWALSEQLKQGGIACVFKEPQYQPALLATLTQGLAIKQQPLDPMASHIKADANGYYRFMAEFAASFISCVQ